MDEMREMLDRVYMDTLMEVTEARTGSEEAKWQLQKLTELHNQRMSEKKFEDESNARHEELRMKEEQLKDSKKDRIIKVVLDGAGIIVPVAVSSYWMAKGLTFEEKGTFTSRTGQWLSSHLRLFKK